MPHLVIEATSLLSDRLDFPALLGPLHAALSASGNARLEDLKSRIHRCDPALAGTDTEAQFIVVRLLITNPRSTDAEHEMLAIIHEHFSAAVQRLNLKVWWQCCVMLQRVARADYLKSEHRPTTALEHP